MSDKGYHGYYDSRYSGDSSYRGRGRGTSRGGSFRGGSRPSHDYYSRSASNNSSHRYAPYYGGRGGPRGGYSSYSGGRDVYRSSDRYETEEELGGGGAEYEENYHGLYRGRGSTNYRGKPSRGGAAASGAYYKGREYEEKARSSLVSTNSKAEKPISKASIGDKPKSYLSKNFTNPWIPILRIQDEKTQSKLESNYTDLASVNKELLELQIQKFKLSSVVDNLDRTIEREALHVQITNEKLEEFTYL